MQVARNELKTGMTVTNRTRSAVVVVVKTDSTYNFATDKATISFLSELVRLLIYWNLGTDGFG